VRGTSNGDTFGLVTTAWERPDFVSPERPVSYATAIAFYNNESVENLVKWKPETAKFAALPLEKFIFKITGWDVTRAEDQQDAHGPLTRGHCKQVEEGRAAALLLRASEEECASIDEQEEKCSTCSSPLRRLLAMLRRYRSSPRSNRNAAGLQRMRWQV
jgi:hypothetical protein